MFIIITRTAGLIGLASFLIVSRRHIEYNYPVPSFILVNNLLHPVYLLLQSLPSCRFILHYFKANEKIFSNLQNTKKEKKDTLRSKAVVRNLFKLSILFSIDCAVKLTELLNEFISDFINDLFCEFFASSPKLS